MADREDAPEFIGQIENPLSNVVNPHAKRIKIQQDEEALRTGQIPKDKIPAKIVEIASDYQEIGQTEKAIDFLKNALRIKNRPDGHILNLLGIYHGALGDAAGQEKFYREAAQAGAGASSLFNLALAQFNRKQNLEAQRTIQDCIVARGVDGPSLTLSAQIEAAINDNAAKTNLLKQAISEFGEPKALDDWALGWMMTAARLAGKADLLKQAQAEKDQRVAGKTPTSNDKGVLPEVAGTLTNLIT